MPCCRRRRGSAGREYQERALVAGNRCGKTVVGAYETAVHLTGMYPHIAAPRRRRPRRDGGAPQHRVCARGRVYEAPRRRDQRTPATDLLRQAPRDSANFALRFPARFQENLGPEKANYRALARWAGDGVWSTKEGCPSVSPFPPLRQSTGWPRSGVWTCRRHAASARRVACAG